MDTCHSGEHDKAEQLYKTATSRPREKCKRLMSSLESLAQHNEKQNNSRLSYRITRFYMHHLARFNRIDWKEQPSNRERRTGLLGYLTWVRHFGLWSNVLFVCSLVSLIHLVWATYAHYRVDFPLSRMERLILMVRAQYKHATTLNETIQQTQTEVSLRWHYLRQIRELKETVAQREKELERLGSPSSHLRFAIENLYVGHILFVIFSYIAPSIYIRWLTHKGQYVLASLANYRYELKSCSQLVSRVVHDHQISARNFARAEHQRLGGAGSRSLVSLQMARHKRSGDNGATSAMTSSAELERASQLNLHLDAHLLEMHLSGQLVPFNRRPEWVAKWTHQLFIGITSFICACLVQDAYVLGTLCTNLRPSSSSSIMRLSWPDLMIFLDVAIVLLCINVSTIFYTNLFVITVSDQTRLSNKLLALITDYLNDTSQLFHEHLLMMEQHQTIRTLHQDRSNTNLLELLMHYKIFVRQLLLLHRRLSYSLVTCMLILFILPITSSVHVPYYPSNLDSTFRWFVMVMSVVVGVPTALLAFPACHMHARCLKLQRKLNNLTAHVAYVQSQPGFRHFYDEHLVSILRRESTIERGHHQDHFAISFSTHLQFDYSTVLQIYLWFGFILISLSFTGQRAVDTLRAYQQQLLAEGGDGPMSGRTKPFVNVIDDPLGLFSR